MSPKVSIIVPVYDMEQYLAECLDSLKSQTLSDIEIICIDDGSSDLSLSILKQYAASDKRFVIITQKHAGTGAARNKGVSIAKGEYIGFVDPDDYIDVDYYEKLYNCAVKNNSDIACANKRIAFSSKKTELIELKKSNIKKDIILSHAALWSKIFKKEFVTKYDFKNLETRYSQDLPFSICAVIAAKRISVADTTYYYRISNQSAYNKKNKNYEEIIHIYKYIDSFIKSVKPNCLKSFAIQHILNKRKIKSFIDWSSKIPSEKIPDFYLEIKTTYPKIYKKFIKKLERKRAQV